MADRRPSIMPLAIGALVLLALFLLFPGVVGAIISIVGIIVCCFLAFILGIILLVILAAIFSIPIFWWKKPSKPDFYSNYRVEEIQDMDEDEDS